MKKKTQLCHLGQDPDRHFGAVNIPPYRASTFLFKTLDSFEKSAQAAHDYGRTGNPSSAAFERAMAELEGAHNAVATSSGLAAITLVLNSLVKTGDHILVTDSVYYPTRRYCENVLEKMGVETEYYNPRIGAGIASLFRDNTRLVYMESPGSLTFEIQDVPTITAACRGRNIATIFDNTWATPLNFRPLDHGVDIVVHSATKYISGHSDLMLGVICCREELWKAVKSAAIYSGNCAGSEELYLALRGLRTMAVRLKQQGDNALSLANWLESRDEVAKVLHPALPSHPDHTIFLRDFSGSSGTFGLILKETDKKKVAAFTDGLTLFNFGFSWGGYESLLLATQPHKIRTATSWEESGFLLRLHVGLEDIEDLKTDLDAGFSRLS